VGKIRLSAWGEADGDTGIRHRIGTILLSIALRVLQVEDMKAYSFYPDGYGGDQEYQVAISSNRVDYWRDYEYGSGVPVWAVVHDDHGILGGFLWWKDARKAASVLSQHFDDYHFREYVLNEESNRVVIGEDEVDEVDKNLRVEKLWANRQFDYDEWDESDRLINHETVRTIDDLKEQIASKNIHNT